MPADEKRVDYPRLDSVADISGGIALGGISPSGSSVMLPYLRVANVQDGYISVTDVKKISVPVRLVERFRLRHGDVLLTEGGDIDKLGRGAVWDGRIDPCLHQNHVFRVRCLETKLLPEFLALYMGSPEGKAYFLRIAKQTTNLASISLSQLSVMPILCPPIAEQRRIVEVVNAESRQEKAIKASIEKLSLINVAAIDDLLEEMEWDCTLFDAAQGSIRNGYSPLESEAWTGVQMLGLGCLTPSGFNPLQLKNAPSSVTTDHAATLRDGDLLMSRANTRELVGMAGVYRDVGTPCIYPDLMMRIRPSNRCSAEFLAAVLMSTRVRRHVRALAQGTSESMVKISAATVREIPIPLPAFEEQKRLLGILNSFSTQIRDKNAELSKLGAVKEGIVGDLLSGRVSV